MLFLVLVFSFGLVLQSTGYEIFEDCDAMSSCVYVSECPMAIASLKRREQHNFKTCGWDNILELICCPKPPTVRNDVKTRKSVQVCNDLYNDISTQVGPQILGGVDAKAGEFPHMAAIGFESENDNMDWPCGGSLISDRYVLTAAHCFLRKFEPRIVRLGKIDLVANRDGLTSQDYEIEKVTQHPQYDIENKFNDIALIRLKTPVVMTNNVRPACLYNETDDPDLLVITGWGSLRHNGPKSELLQKGDVIPVDFQSCNNTYSTTDVFPRTLRQTQICAGYGEKTVETCSGDSGGPLQFRDSKESTIYSIVGITSFGDLCGGARKIPSVYTRVVSYLDWIESIVWPLGQQVIKSENQ